MDWTYPLIGAGAGGLLLGRKGLLLGGIVGYFLSSDIAKAEIIKSPIKAPTDGLTQEAMQTLAIAKMAVPLVEEIAKLPGILLPTDGAAISGAIVPTEILGPSFVEVFPTEIPSVPYAESMARLAAGVSVPSVAPVMGEAVMSEMIAEVAAPLTYIPLEEGTIIGAAEAVPIVGGAVPETGGLLASIAAYPLAAAIVAIPFAALGAAIIGHLFGGLGGRLSAKTREMHDYQEQAWNTAFPQFNLDRVMNAFLAAQLYGDEQFARNMSAKFAEFFNAPSDLLYGHKGWRDFNWLLGDAAKGAWVPSLDVEAAEFFNISYNVSIDELRRRENWIRNDFRNWFMTPYQLGWQSGEGMDQPIYARHIAYIPWLNLTYPVPAPVYDGSFDIWGNGSYRYYLKWITPTFGVYSDNRFYMSRRFPETFPPPEGGGA